MKMAIMPAVLLLLAMSACSGKQSSAGDKTAAGSASPTAQAGGAVARPSAQAGSPQVGSPVASPAGQDSATPSAPATTPSAESVAGGTGGLTGTWVAVTTGVGSGGPQPGAFTVTISESGGDYKMTSISVIPYPDLDGSSCAVPSGVEIAYFPDTPNQGVYSGRLDSWIPNSQGNCESGSWMTETFSATANGKIIMNVPDLDGVVTTLTRYDE
jgi:hypothetical protein